MCVASKDWSNDDLRGYIHKRKSELEAAMQLVWQFNDDDTITIVEEKSE